MQRTEASRREDTCHGYNAGKWLRRAWKVQSDSRAHAWHHDSEADSVNMPLLLLSKAGNISQDFFLLWCWVRATGGTYVRSGKWKWGIGHSLKDGAVRHDDNPAQSCWQASASSCVSRCSCKSSVSATQWQPNAHCQVLGQRLKWFPKGQLMPQKREFPRPLQDFHLCSDQVHMASYIFLQALICPSSPVCQVGVASDSFSVSLVPTSMFSLFYPIL